MAALDRCSQAAAKPWIRTVANLTGGVAIRNTNDLPAGLDKIMARSNGYYVLAYTPLNKFDQKFHKLEVKVRRGGAKVYHHHGYLAREDNLAVNAPRKNK